MPLSERQILEKIHKGPARSLSSNDLGTLNRNALTKLAAAVKCINVIQKGCKGRFSDLNFEGPPNPQMCLGCPKTGSSTQGCPPYEKMDSADTTMDIYFRDVGTNSRQ